MMELVNEAVEKETIGYLGPKGTYSEEVTWELYKASEEKYIFRPYTNIDLVIRAVEKGEISSGVVPVENSVEGSVNVTLDSLAHDANLVITREIIQPIRNNLLVRSETNEIEVILSHPQPLAQCRQYLMLHFPNAKLKAVESTAMAAALVADGAKNTAAIAGTLAGKIYGLTNYATDIQDFDGNCTRFIVVKKIPDDFKKNVRYKTSVICRINGESPGSLCDILVEFAQRNVNLTKIESRPARTNLGEYIFFLDIEGSYRDNTVRDALIAVKQKSLWFKNLGSYPMYTS